MKSKFLPSLLLMSLFSLIVVSAFGVSSPYWEGNPLELAAGDTEVVTLNLQNMANAVDDVTAEVVVVEGSDIASLDQTTYDVKAGASENCFLTIKVPSDAQIGDVYEVKVETKTVTPGDVGMVAMGTGMTTAFSVVVNGSNETNGLWFYAIGAVILIAAIYIIIIARKK
jgi:uncharacterized membrane protein